MRLIRLPARLFRDRSGLAMIEFAFAVPVLLMLVLGGLEVARFAVASLRVSEIAMTVADNAGRVRTSIDEADINELMVGARLIGKGIDFANNGRIILSDLERRTTTTGAGGVGAITTDNPNGYRQWIRWQRCAGALNVTSSYGTPLDNGGNAVVDLDSTVNDDHGAVETRSTRDGMGPAANMISAGSGTAVMFVEVVYTYRPITPLFYSQIRTIRVTQAFNVRQRVDYPLHNDSNLSGNARSDCRLFSAAVPVV